MANNLKFELDRAFRNRPMAIALAVGCALSLWHLWEYVLPVRGYVVSGDYPLSSYGKWMGGENYSLQATVYFMWVPILCALPHSGSFAFDCASGYGSQAASRQGWRPYLRAKYLAVFLSGAAVAVLPLAFDFLMTSLFLPAVRPQAGLGLFPIGADGFLGDLYYAHPFLYLCLYLGMDGVFFGLFTTLSLCASLFTRNRFAVLLAPFLAYMLFYALGTTTLQLAACPAGYLRPSQLFVPRWPWMLGELALLLAGGAGFFAGFRRAERGLL